MKNFNVRKVLVPMDFSKHSLNALNTAITICLQHNASLTLIQVIDNANVIIPSNREVMKPVTDLGRIANENLNVLIKSLSSRHDIDVDYVVEAGVTSHVICDHARRHGFDMIIMGTGGTFGFRRIFTETTAYKVVKGSPCPVLSVPSNRLFTRFRKVIFPVRSASRMLDKYEVVRPIISSSDCSILITGLTKVNDAEDFRKVSLAIDTLRHKLDNDQVVYSSKVHFCDSISGRLLEISHNEKPDLIVIVARIETSLKRFLLEYYAKSIVSSARCPVLSVRPDMAAIN